MRNKTGWSIAYLAGLVTFLLALPVTFFITRIHQFFPGQVEQAILVIYAVLVLTLLIPGCIYLLRRRRSATYLDFRHDPFHHLADFTFRDLPFCGQG